MADIAFLLLIFFLVATTMNVDTGITRVLPPIPPEDVKVDDIKVKERNLLPIFINAYDQIMVAGTPMPIFTVTDAVKRFVINASEDPELPEKKPTDIAMPDGSTWTYPVSEGIVSLLSDARTSYDLYIQVQNELTRAFSEMRDDVARQKFGRAYSEIGKEEQEAVNDAVPLKISEAEPLKTEGRN